MGPLGGDGTLGHVGDVRGEIYVLSQPRALRKGIHPRAGRHRHPVLYRVGPLGVEPGIARRMGRCSRGAASGMRLCRGTAMDSLPSGKLLRQLINPLVWDRTSRAIIILFLVRAKPFDPRSSALGAGCRRLECAYLRNSGEAHLRG